MIKMIPVICIYIYICMYTHNRKNLTMNVFVSMHLFVQDVEVVSSVLSRLETAARKADLVEITG